MENFLQSWLIRDRRYIFCMVRSAQLLPLPIASLLRKKDPEMEKRVNEWGENVREGVSVCLESRRCNRNKG
jgi:hypothetical protein